MKNKFRYNKKLRELREKLQFTQKEMWTKLRVSRGTYVAWEQELRAMPEFKYRGLLHKAREKNLV